MVTLLFIMDLQMNKYNFIYWYVGERCIDT